MLPQICPREKLRHSLRADGGDGLADCCVEKNLKGLKGATDAAVP
jgi:hypothetical protein